MVTILCGNAFRLMLLQFGKKGNIQRPVKMSDLQIVGTLCYLHSYQISNYFLDEIVRI